jgi:hypothetical protein
MHRASRLTGLVLAVLAGLPSAASAQVSGQGSPLTSPANYPYHCETRWMPGVPGNPGGFGPGGAQDYVEQPIGPSTCTVFQSGATPGTSHIVPNSGKVTVARVKSGPNPAPVSIATVRQFTGKRPSDGQLVTTCCQGISETETVNLTPNGITEIPVNFIVESKPYDPNNPGVAGYRDWVVVNIHGTTGTLPIYDAGLPRPIIAPAGDPGAVWHFPQIDPSQTNQNAWIASRFEVLMNYDWVPTSATTPPTACASSVALRQAACTPGAPGATSLAEVRSSRVRLRRGKIGVSVKCARTDGQACKGKVRLRTAAKKPVLLASSTLNVKAGKTKTVSVKLNTKARKRLKGKRKIRVEVALSGQAAITKDVALRR